MSNSINTSSQPEASEFFNTVPLYQTVSFGQGSDAEVLKVVLFDGTAEFYCPQCQQSVVFVSEVADKGRADRWDTRKIDRSIGFSGGASGEPYSQEPEVDSGIYTTNFHCSREQHHLVRFIFLVEKTSEGEIRLTKIGQHPSLADLTASGLKKYRKILKPSDFSEFSRAVGLATHGIGIGSFVYLRRIFERLVEEAHQEAKQDVGWDEAGYTKGRMEEKIKLLKAHLPPFLVDNWQIYGILSKGIHELSEDECRAYFDVLKGGIESS